LTEKINTSREAVQKTGKAFLIAGSAFGVFLLLTGSHVSGWGQWDWQRGFETTVWRWFLGSGITLCVLSYIAYPIMKPVHVAWMKFAFVLGWINVRILLGLFFYLIVTPIGVIMRLFGKDLLDKKIDRSAKSYWIKKERTGFDPGRYERLF
jgi:hypothetical protein